MLLIICSDTAWSVFILNFYDEERSENFPTLGDIVWDIHIH